MVGGDFLEDSITGAHEPQRSGYESLSTQELLSCIAQHDREAAAEFLARAAPLIRQRFRARLSPSLRRLLDSSDVFSSVSRRLDDLVRRGGLSALSEPQLWGLVNQLARAAIVDKARVLKRLRTAEDPDGEWARLFLARVDAGDRIDRFDETLGEVMDAAGDERDRQVLAMWMQGVPFAQIGVAISLEAGAVRQLWYRIRTRLRSRLEVAIQ